MRATLVVLALIGPMTGCSKSDSIADAQTEYNMEMSQNPTTDEQCTANRKLAEAYLKAHDTANYPPQKRIADQTCLNASIERRLSR